MSIKFYDWVDSRTGFVTFMRHKLGQAVPGDAFFFCFGGISLVIIVMQLLTGIFLILFFNKYSTKYKKNKKYKKGPWA